MDKQNTQRAVSLGVLGLSVGYILYSIWNKKNSSKSSSGNSSSASGKNDNTVKKSTSLQNLNNLAVDTTKPPTFSFEYFPPKTPAGVKTLYKRWFSMIKQGPEFIDVTWGAGGSTSDLTLKMCGDFTALFPDVEVNMHLTCTNITPEKVKDALTAAKGLGIRNITALRGDPPAGQEKWESIEGGFECALDLVKHIRKEHGDYFGIAVAGYPEGHPDIIKEVTDIEKLSATEKKRLVSREGKYYVCSDADFQDSLNYLKAKVNAGANCIISQLFFDEQCFIDFVDACRAAGINVPILPGIMPISKFAGFWRMTGFCKTRIPADMLAQLEAVKDDDKKTKELGIKLVADMAKKVWSSGRVKSLHFYTLNQTEAVYAIMKELKIAFVDTKAAEFEKERSAKFATIETMLKAK